jgi:hypothetical protein
MIEIISGLIFVLTTWMIYKRAALLFISLFSIIFVFGWMLISTMYIDCHSNIYSVELFRDIGGGIYSLPLACTYLILGIASLLVFRPTKLYRLSKYLRLSSNKIIKMGPLELNKIPIILLSIFVIYLYIELFRYPIPFFSGIDRGLYAIKYNNVSLHILYMYKDFISLFIGVLFFYEFKKRSKCKNIVLFLYGAILIYFVLVGNKFSALFFSLCFFVIPLSLNLIMKDMTKNKKKRKKTILKVVVCIIIFISLISLAMYNYFFEVKSWNNKKIESHITHRIFVQQGQIWWSTAKRIIQENNWNSKESFRKVFVEPIYSKNSNTSLHYLMYKEVGKNRVLELIKVGAGYTGAFPAILLELFGPWGIYFAVFIFSIIMLNLLYLLLCSIAKHYYLSIFFIAFVFQPWLYLFLGGKIHYFTMEMFMLKLGLMLIAIVFDQIIYFLYHQKYVEI